MQLFSDKITAGDLDNMADRMGIEIYNYRDGERRSRGKHAGKIGHQFTLRPRTYFKGTGEFGDSGKNFKRPRAWAVSWAGHYVFMKACYIIDHNAVIKTGLGVVTGTGGMEYHGALDFEVYAHMTGHRNIGSMVEPMVYKDDQHRDHVQWDDETDLDRYAEFVALAKGAFA